MAVKVAKDKKADKGEYFLEIDGDGYKFVGDLREELDAVMAEDSHKTIYIYKLHSIATRKSVIYDIKEV